MEKFPAFILYLPRHQDHTNFRHSAYSWAVILRLPNEGRHVIIQGARVSLMQFPLM